MIIIWQYKFCIILVPFGKQFHSPNSVSARLAIAKGDTSTEKNEEEKKYIPRLSRQVGCFLTSLAEILHSTPLLVFFNVRPRLQSVQGKVQDKGNVQQTFS